MKIFAIVFCLVILTCSLSAQTPEQVLATAAGQKFGVGDLPPNVAEAYLNLAKSVAERRRALLADQIVETVFEIEASSKKMTLERYLAQVKSRVPAPAEKDIQAVYDANREKLGRRTLDEMRPRIVAVLREEPEQKALQAAFDGLKAKYRIVPGKDVNAADLRPSDVLATIGAKKITAGGFDETHKIALYETKARVFDAVKFALNELLYNALVAVEAKALKIETSELIAREVTDKMREYTATERFELENKLRRQLFAKYQTKILLKEPAPLKFAISTAGAPSKGAAAAPVTVVMFSDFQCSACAAVHPVLQRVLAEYGERARFVVRHFPLTQIHADAFQAALAASAAHAQGKFFEYTEILYRNQEALDAASLKKYAAEAGLNLPQFELDLQSAKTAENVRRDQADGRNLGITGTPAVFVNGVKVRSLSADGFREAIDKELKK